MHAFITMTMQSLMEWASLCLYTLGMLVDSPRHTETHCTIHDLLAVDRDPVCT